jgi:hypothetical protein
MPLYIFDAAATGTPAPLDGGPWVTVLVVDTKPVPMERVFLPDADGITRWPA